MPRLDELSVAELLGRLGARTPAPGGGSAAALGCAVAAALVEMAGRYAGTDARRAAVLRTRALELADADAEAFADVLAASGDAREAARSLAAEPPAEIAAAAAEVAALGAELINDGNPELIGDALTAVLLAEAACRAASALVQINLAATADDPRRGQVAQHAAAAAQARDRALASV